VAPPVSAAGWLSALRQQGACAAGGAERRGGQECSPWLEFMDGATTLTSSTFTSGVLSVTISTPDGRPCEYT
jgi:hypothetical protein